MEAVAFNQLLDNKLVVAGTSISPVLPTGGDSRPRHATFTNEGPGDVRWLADNTGTAVTATTGTLLLAGDALEMLEGDHWGMIATIRFIREAGVDATIDCSFYG